MSLRKSPFSRQLSLQTPIPYANGSVDSALYKLFKKHLLGPAQSNEKPFKGDLYEKSWKVYDIFRPMKGCEDRLKIRLTRTSDSKSNLSALARELKFNGCDLPKFSIGNI